MGTVLVSDVRTLKERGALVWEDFAPVLPRSCVRLQIARCLLLPPFDFCSLSPTRKIPSPFGISLFFSSLVMEVSFHTFVLERPETSVKTVHAC